MYPPDTYPKDIYIYLSDIYPWTLKPIFHYILCWVLALAWTPNATVLRYLYQHVGIYTKNLRCPQRTFLNLRHPTQNPNASQWNIGCIGFQTQNSCVGHLHFMLFVSISFALGSQHKRSFQWNMGCTPWTLTQPLVTYPLGHIPPGQVCHMNLYHQGEDVTISVVLCVTIVD